MNDTPFHLNDYRCRCGKLLLKGLVFDGTMEIKCKRCGEINKIGAIKLLDDATHYLLVTDPSGKITNSSSSACRILGYTMDELIGKNITLINPTLKEDIRRKFLTSPSITLDTTHQTKEGENLKVTVLFKPNSLDSSHTYLLEYVSLIGNDTSAAASQFKDNSCDYYFDLDKYGTIDYISHTMSKIFGFNQSDLIGKNYFDFLPFTMIQKEKEIFAHFSSTGESYREVQDVGLDTLGQSIYSDLYFTAKFTESGKFEGYHVLGWLTSKNS